MARRARLDEAPPAPWAPFPLVELCILVGIVLIAVGFLASGPRARAGLVAGLGLVTVATLELSIREHLAGYRSHTMLLAGALALAVAVLLSLFTVVPREAVLVAAAGVFGAAWWALRLLFRRRSGGLAFRA